MVSSEEEQPLSLAHLLVEHLHELGKLPVELHVDVMVLLSACAIFMTDGIRGRDTDSKEVGDRVLAELFAIEGSLCHLEGLCHSDGSSLDISARLDTNLFVLFLHPVGQLVHIIS